MSLSSSRSIGSGQSSQELAFASWFVRHDLALRKFGYRALIALCVLTWGYSLWTLFDAYALSYPRENRIPARIASLFIHENANEMAAPREIEIGGTLTFTANGQEQMLAPVNNPNALWWADVRFRFRDGALETPLQTATLLPSDTRLLTELGWNKARLASPSLSIESVTWKRIDASVVGPDGYAAFAQQRVQLLADQPRYEGTIEIEGKRLGKSTFLLRNPSGYTYRNVEILTMLYSNESLAGIQKLVLPRVEAGSSQTISQVWPDNPAGITRVEPKLFLNVLAPEAFVRP